MASNLPTRRLATSPFPVAPTPAVESYAVGDRVAHDEHGLGVVVATDPTGVRVDFGHGHVRVASPFARMEKL